MIDTELLSQIQAAGITDADYERAERHIEVLKTLSNLTYKGIFIYDNFKRKYLYISPNPFGWLEYNKEAFENMGSIFIDAFIKPNSKKAIIDAFVYCYQYIKNLSQEEKENIAIYCNYDYMSIDGKHLPSTKCTPLEFAPDGSPWLMLGITTSEPHGKHDMFCIHNILRKELVSYNPKNDKWEKKQVPTLSPKDKTVLLLLSQGQAAKSVAERLGMSEYTVATHRKNIFRKLGAHTVAEAMAFAVKYKAI